MPNDELLNSFADLQEADRQFSYLEKKVEKYVADIANANKVKINVSGSLTEMATGADKVAAANQTVVNSYGELSNSVKQVIVLKQQLNGHTKETIANAQSYAKATLDEAKATTENAKARDQNAKAALNEAKASTENAKQKEIEIRYTAALTKEKERIEKQAQKTAKQLAQEQSALYQLKKEYKEASDAAEELGAKQVLLERDLANATPGSYNFQVKQTELARLAPVLKEAQDKAIGLQKSLLQVEQAVGKSQRNVGNYNSTLMAMSQILREAPSFAYSFGTGILALSNNIPILADEIGKLKAANKDLKAAGEETIPVWQTLWDAISSPSGLITIAVGAFTLLSARLSTTGEGMTEAQQKAEDMKQAYADLGYEIRDNLNKELEKTGDLFNAAKDIGLAYNARIEAINELLKLYPELLANISQETFLTGKATEQHEKAIAIIAKQSHVDEFKKRLELMQKQRDDLEKEINSYDPNAFAVTGNFLIGEDPLREKQLAFEKLNKDIEDTKDNLSILSRELNYLRNPKHDGRILSDIDADIKAQEQVRDNTAAISAEHGAAIKRLKELQDEREKYMGKEKAAKESEIAGINALLEAQKHYESASAELAKQRYQQEAEKNKAIFDDENQSLSVRLEAYENYQANMINIAMIDEAKEIAIIQDKLKAIEQKEQLYREGKLKLDKNGRKALQVDTDALNVELLAKQEAFQTKMSQLTAEGIVKREAIRKSDRDRQRREEREYLTEVETGLEDRIASVEDSYNKESTVLAQSYLDRTISEKKFREELKKLRNKYNVEELDLQITNDELLLQQDELSAEARLRIQRRLNANRNKRTSAQADAAGLSDSFKDKLGISKEDFDNTAKVANEAISLNEELVKIIDQRYQKELDALDEKKKKIDEVAQAEIDAINQSMLSDADKQKKIAAIKGQAAAQDKQIQQEQNAIKRKQAIADKEASIASIIEKTAIAVISAYAELPPPFDVILAGAIAAVGAAQLAAAISAPIPQYATGTEDHPGGPARVGEAGPEVIDEPGRAPYIVDKDTIMNLPKHTRVIPQHQLTSDIAGMSGFMTAGLLQQIGVVNNNDYSALQNTLKSEGEATRKAIRNMPQTKFITSGGELYRVVASESGTTTFINKKLS